MFESLPQHHKHTHNAHRGHFQGVNEQQACGRDDSHSVKS